MTFYLLLASAAFAGAVVSGFAGFAFSGVAGVILMHLMPPTEAVPLMMACSIAVQGAGLVTLRKNINWRQSAPYVLGGMVGHSASLVSASSHRCMESADRVWPIHRRIRRIHAHLSQIAWLLKREHTSLSTAVGFLGGLIGGFTAMPGAAPTIWCNLRGIAKEEQRGIIQPYIAILQCVGIALLVAGGAFTRATLFDVIVCLPALAAGTAIGLFLFRKASQASYRCIVLSILFAGGIGLAV